MAQREPIETTQTKCSRACCSFRDELFLIGECVNTLRISIMISLGSREEVVFILHVKRRDLGFT